MPSSSCISRITASRGVSPDSTFPPGNSHIPPKCVFSGRLAMRTCLLSLTIMPTTTLSVGVGIISDGHDIAYISFRNYKDKDRFVLFWAGCVRREELLFHQDPHPMILVHS